MSSSNFETTIQAYLENRAKTDSLFAETYRKADKSIEECIKYIYSKARKLADEEISKMREADNKGDYEKAEVHDFNSRALSRMADIYYEIIKRED